MTTREQAMQWWNNQNFMQKGMFLDKHTEFEDRGVDSLTGSEIELIWSMEVEPQPDIYLDRLRQQYKVFKNWEKDKQGGRIAHFEYQAMRLFCLDTQLVSFNDIEQMEFEVNSSF